VPWHWPIAAYLPTKHIAGATFALLGASALAGRLDPVAMRYAGAFALLNLAITLGLLVYDLDRPDRMIYLFTRPQWRSWVARAAWLLAGFSVVAGGWWALELAGVTAARLPLAALCVPLGVGAAVYSAFLFAQAEGRDLWQSPHLPFALTGQAAALGIGTLAAFGGSASAWATPAFALAVGVSTVLTVVGDLATPQPSEVARRAAWEMTRGRWRGWYAGGAVGLGAVAPLALLAIGAPAGVALVVAGVGIFAWARAFTASAQEIPNS
jgi:formate-dependent nitrite reductase membrane component NrfD